MELAGKFFNKENKQGHIGERGEWGINAQDVRIAFLKRDHTVQGRKNEQGQQVQRF